MVDAEKVETPVQADAPSLEASEGEPWLVRSMRFLALLAVAVSALAYPLSIEARLYRAMFGRVSETVFWGRVLEALDPVLRFQISPLILKETLTAWVLLFLVAFWVCWKLLFASRSSRRDRAGIFCLFGLLVWLLVSMFRAPHFGLDSMCGYTAFNGVLWILFLVAGLDLPWSGRFARRAVWWLLAIGFVLMAISVAQATRGVSELVFRFMLRHESAWNRNLYGSLIGHNTGVASACLGPFFFALGLLLRSRRRFARILLGFYVALACFFFVITQSRSVWAIFLLLTPLFLLANRRAIGFLPSARTLVFCGAGLALVLASQVVPSPVNFLKIRPSDYGSRLQGMRPEVVLRGTRARILMVSMPWVARRPLAGYGLGAFPVVYPAMQADYFNRHPDTALRMVDRLTARAHNDYLQTLLETGLVGLGLAMAALFLVARAGLRRLRRAESSDERLWRTCAGFAALGILLHAFVDFPFHIAPLATLFVFYAILFAARDGSGSETAGSSESPWAGRSFGLRAVSVAVVLLVWAVVGVVLGQTSRRVRADVLEAGGSRLLETAKPLPGQRAPSANRQVALLTKAREEYRQSLRVDPLQFGTALRQAHANYGLADIYVSTALRARRMGRAGHSRNFARSAAGFVESAQAQLRQASHMARPFSPVEEPYVVEGLGPRVNLPLLITLARSWSLLEELGMLGELAPVRAFDAYRKAVYYRPNQIAPIEELQDAMWRNDLGTEQDREHFTQLHRRALREIHEADVEGFFFRCDRRLERLVEQERYDEAVGLARAAVEIEPDMSARPSIPRVLGHIGLLRGDPSLFEEAARVLQIACPGYPEAPLFAAVADIRAGGIDAAEKAIHDVLSREARFFDAHESLARMWWFVECELLDRKGLLEDAKRLSESTLEGAPSRARGLSERGRVRLGIFGDREGAMGDFLEALHCDPPLESPHALFDLIRHLASVDRGADLGRAVEIARGRLARNPVVQKLLDALDIADTGSRP